MTANIPRQLRTGAAALAVLAACSTLPDTDYPPHRGFDVVVTYQLDRAGRVEVPVSGPELTIFALETEPSSREQFGEDGPRYLVPDEPTPELRVFCRGRLYGERRGDGVWFRPLRELFPGAASVEMR